MSAKEIDRNSQYVRQEMSHLRNGRIIYVSRHARIREIDNAIKLEGLDVNRIVRKEDIMYILKER